MTEVAVLETRLDTAAADTLSSTLTPFLGKAVTLDASQVEQLGGRCLEILLALRQANDHAGQPLLLSSPSQPFLADLATFGLTAQDISTGGTT